MLSKSSLIRRIVLVCILLLTIPIIEVIIGFQHLNSDLCNDTYVLTPTMTLIGSGLTTLMIYTIFCVLNIYYYYFEFKLIVEIFAKFTIVISMFSIITWVAIGMRIIWGDMKECTEPLFIGVIYSSILFKLIVLTCAIFKCCKIEKERELYTI